MRTTLSRLLAILFLSVVTVCVSACGNTNFDDFTQTGSGGGLSLAGRYLGANNLNGSQTSNLDVTVANDGSAKGNLTVNAVTAQTINAGTYPVTGTVNLTTGTFSFSGTITGLGSFTITGTLPVSGNVATYQLTINNQTFSGSIQPASLGTPNPPSGGSGTSNSKLISGGTLSNFTFTPGGSYNGANPPVSTSSLISGAVGTGVNGEDSATFALTETSLVNNVARVRSFVVSIVVPAGEDLVVGTTYNLADQNKRGAVIALSESEGVNVVNGYSLTSGTTGQVTLVALDSNSITIDFTFNNVGPNSEISGNPSQGTFSTSGRIVGNFAKVP